MQHVGLNAYIMHFCNKICPKMNKVKAATEVTTFTL